MITARTLFGCNMVHIFSQHACIWTTYGHRMEEIRSQHGPNTVTAWIQYTYGMKRIWTRVHSMEEARMYTWARFREVVASSQDVPCSCAGAILPLRVPGDNQQSADILQAHTSPSRLSAHATRRNLQTSSAQKLHGEWVRACCSVPQCKDRLEFWRAP
jgi:hypothetical protein